MKTILKLEHKKLHLFGGVVLAYFLIQNFTYFVRKRLLALLVDFGQGVSHRIIL
jgi:hypothetical protein